MPIYEFKCQCGYAAEEERKISDRKKHKKCLKCNKNMKQVISTSTFHLKGSGWYTTDYKSKPSDKKKDKK